ncbi:TPA: glycosyltransferase family 2 protein [Candidatus Poribacteria bacterium]|nr:glycosyltransferase family 2 protein [Candidatus Poribacteria bacterium]
MRICIIIPGYNESRSIGKVVANARKIIDDIVVIDDGSKDNTAQIAQDAGAYVIKHEVNKGKGAALRTGFQYAIDHSYDAVITMDSDGQHDPDDIPNFLYSLDKIGSGIIIGTRMGDISTMPLIRRCTNKLTSFTASMIAHQKIEDSQSGFRLITTDVLKTVKLETAGFETESEILIKASKAGFRIISVPIKTIYGEEKSKIKPMRDTYKFLRLLFRSLRW